MSKHTPGPWVVEERPPNMRVIFAGLTTDRRPAPCVLMDGDQEANAHLIAAAPEMLEALKVVTDTLIEWLPRLRGQREAEEMSRAYVAGQIAMAQAAIAKAEGRS